MKLNKNILIAGAAIFGMAACQPEVKQPTDAEIDVLVQAKVDEVKATLQEECDNSILAMATAKADSTMVAAANKPARVIQAPAPKPAPKRKKVVTKKKKKVTPPPPPPPPNQGKKNNAGGQNLGKKGNTSGQSGKAAPQGQNMGKKKR